VTIEQNSLTMMFSNPVMARDAIWFVAGTGPGTPVRVIEKSPDNITDYGAGRIWSPTLTIDVLATSTPNLAAGDIIQLGAISYNVQGEPRRDRNGLILTAELVPA